MCPFLFCFGKKMLPTVFFLIDDFQQRLDLIVGKDVRHARGVAPRHIEHVHEIPGVFLAAHKIHHAARGFQRVVQPFAKTAGEIFPAGDGVVEVHRAALFPARGRDIVHAAKLSSDTCCTSARR